MQLALCGTGYAVMYYTVLFAIFDYARNVMTVQQHWCANYLYERSFD